MFAAFIILFLLFLLPLASLRFLSPLFADILVIYGSHAFLQLASFSLHDVLQYFGRKCISRYSNYLDVHRLEAMPIIGAHPLIYDCSFDKYRNTVVGSWIKRWLHCEGSSTRSSR